MFRRGKLAFLNTKDDRVKIINERINLAEKHLMEMCAHFAQCTRKMAKFRDSFDELAKCMKMYSDDEEINETMAEGLKNFGNAITILGDYMDLNVHRMELKVVNELAKFENLCKVTRDNLRTAVIARDKEVLKQRQLLELKSKFSANNSAADAELLKAKTEVNRTNKAIDEIINNFEKHKLSDIKTILSDVILISMKYHTKALEALTASYYDISNIDDRHDYSMFVKLMKSKNEANQEKKSGKKSNSQRSQSMESLERDQLLSPLSKKDKMSKSTKNLTNRKTDDDETDEDDDDDDDDDDRDSEEEEENESDDESDGKTEEDDDNEQDESDNSKSDDDSHTDADDVDESKTSDSASEVKANSKFIYKKPLAKPQVKHPFKAVAAAHVPKKTAQRDKNVFVTKRSAPGAATGGIRTAMPRLVGKHDKNKKAMLPTTSAAAARSDNGGESRKRIEDTNNSDESGSDDDRRGQFTIVAIKKTSKSKETSENVIDCTRHP